MARLSRGQRKNAFILVVNGNRYEKNKIHKEKVYWRCVRKECRATAVTNVFQFVVTNEENTNINILHGGEQTGHTQDDQQILLVDLKQQMAETIVADPTSNLKDVFNRHCVNNLTPQVEELNPSYKSLQSFIKRRRAETLPPIPETIEDVTIDGEWALTATHHRFLRRLDNDWGIAVFISKVSSRVLQQCQTIYIDGTFRTAPRPYMQFVTVHGRIRDRVIALAFCLSTGKTTGQYRQMLKSLKRTVRRDTGLELAPALVVTDFEMSILSALESELPHSSRHGCFFHFAQSLWRQVQALGLGAAYRTDQSLKDFVKKVTAIAYLPVPLVRYNFNELMDNRTTVRLIRRFPELRQFTQYFSNSYISPTGMFPLTLWNAYNRTMDDRSNNYVEGTLIGLFFVYIFVLLNPH